MLNTSFFNIQRIGILVIAFLISINVSFMLYMNNTKMTYISVEDVVEEVVEEVAEDFEQVVQENNLIISSEETKNSSDKNIVAGEVKDSKHAYGVYIVREGDNLYWIAERYDSSIDELMKLNGFSNDTIRPSQALIVPLRTLREYPVGVSLTDKEVQWIAQMIHAEARGEPYTGQVAVGAVIINRLKSRQFPNTVHDVLFQRNAFQPIRDGSFFQPASEVAYRAALEALSGHDPTHGAVFFFNPRISNDRFMHARPAVVTIGQHRFMH